MILIIISVLLYLDTAFEENIRKNIIPLPSDFKTTIAITLHEKEIDSSQECLRLQSKATGSSFHAHFHE